jgi:hypothetical protein
MKDNQGRYRTLSLFKEYKQEGFKWYWTIPQLKKIYLEYNHIPHYEYEFANDHFEDWQHWEKVADGGMKFAVDEWRAELDVKIKSKGINALIKIASGDGASAIQAAKYLAEKGYAQKRGRPSKAEVEGEKKRQAGDSELLKRDAERIGIH